mgnify:FL=1
MITAEDILNMNFYKKEKIYRKLQGHALPCKKRKR